MPGSPVLDVHPSGFTDAAGALGDVVAEWVRLAWVGLEFALEGTYGMAGSDDTGSAWGASYETAAAVATLATEDVVNACYRLAALLEQTGLNYADAEVASTPRAAAGVARNRWAASSLSLGVLESAVGIGMPAPAGWGTLQHAIGCLWPDGHQDLLHTAAQAWTRAGEQIRSVLADVDRAAGALMLQQAPEVDDAVLVVEGMRLQLADLGSMYARIGEACTGYARHLDQSHHAIIEELKSFLEMTVAIEAAGGLFAVFTCGLSELVAQGGEAAEITRAASVIRAIIETLTAVTAELRATLEAVSTRVSEIAAKMQPILARRLEEVRLAAAGDRGEIAAGRRLATRAEPTTAATDATTAEGAALARLDEAAATSDAATGSPLATPSVANAKLQNIVNDLYKGTTKPGRVGNGTTADAIRQELALLIQVRSSG